MADEITPAQPQPDRSNLLRERWKRLIDGGKRKLQERRAQKEKESPQDRAARRTANATLAMAIFTVVIAFVGILQWAVIRAQLEEMRRQGDLTEALIDSPIWLTGIKTFQLSDPKMDGFATLDVVVKNAGRQLGIIERLVVTIRTQGGFEPPLPSLETQPYDAGCITFGVGEITLLAGEQRTLHAMCLPKLRKDQVVATLASKRFTYVKVILIYYDRRRVASEKGTLFLYRPPEAGTKTHSLGGFAALWSKEIEVPKAADAYVEGLQRNSNAVGLKLDLDLEKAIQRNQPIHPAPPSK